jgi:hypothetical protein
VNGWNSCWNYGYNKKLVGGGEMRGYIKVVSYALIAVICFWFLDALIHSAVHHEETFTIIKQKAAESKPKLATNEWSSAFDICFSSR